MSDYKLKRNFILILSYCLFVSSSLSSSNLFPNKVGDNFSCKTELSEFDPCGGISGLSFYASDETVAKGDVVFVAITASQFNVATFSWSMAYDDQIIRLDSVINENPATGARTLPNFGDGRKDIFENYNTVGFNPLSSTLPPASNYPAGTNKIITMVWATPNAQPFPKNDCEALFYMCFTAIGNPGDISPVEFLNKPTNIDVTDGVNTLLSDDSGFGGGSVEISGSSNVAEAIENANIRLTPNPFREKTTLEFLLKESSQTQISIYDLEGRKIYEQTDLRSAGAQSIQLNESLFSGSGIYYVKISTEEFTKTEKLFLVR